MRKIFFGQTLDGNTLIVGNPSAQGISTIYIDGKSQMAPNEFKFTLNRFGNINPAKLDDYQKGIKELFKIK